MLIFVSSKTFLLLAVLWTGSCGQDIGAIYNAISDGTTQSQSQCADGNTDDVTSGSIIPCSRSEDPYSGTRDVYDDLMGNKDNKAYSAETESRRANNINKEQPSSYSHSAGLAKTKGITSGIEALSTWATEIPELTKKLDIGNKVGTFTNALKEALDGEQTKKLLKKGIEHVERVS